MKTEAKILERFAHIPETLGGVILPGEGVMIMPGASSEKGLSDWQRARLGKITCSNFHRVTRGGGKGWSQTAMTYMNELIWEWLTGQPASNFTGNRATEWGQEHEAEAIAAYEKQYRRKVERGKFVRAKLFHLVGGTPDGVGKSTGLEVKCPYGAANHVAVLLDDREGLGRVPKEYQDQVLGHMLITGKKGCVFVSYDPRPKRKEWRMAVVEVPRNEHEIQELSDRLTEFEELLIKRLDKLGVNWRQPDPK